MGGGGGAAVVRLVVALLCNPEGRGFPNQLRCLPCASYNSEVSTDDIDSSVLLDPQHTGLTTRRRWRLKKKHFVCSAGLCSGSNVFSLQPLIPFQRLKPHFHVFLILWYWMNTWEFSCLFVNYADGVSNVARSVSPLLSASTFFFLLRVKPAGYIALAGTVQVFGRVRKIAKSDY
jgi:hypothetical protein